MANGLHPQKRWGRRAEDPFRGLRAGPVRSSPHLFIRNNFREIQSGAVRLREPIARTREAAQVSSKSFKGFVGTALWGGPYVNFQRIFVSRAATG
jgi:hypothetical protein